MFHAKFQVFDRGFVCIRADGSACCGELHGSVLEALLHQRERGVEEPVSPSVAGEIDGERCGPSWFALEDLRDFLAGVERSRKVWAEELADLPESEALEILRAIVKKRGARPFRSIHGPWNAQCWLTDRPARVKAKLVRRAQGNRRGRRALA